MKIEFENSIRRLSCFFLFLFFFLFLPSTGHQNDLVLIQASRNTATLCSVDKIREEEDNKNKR